MKVIEKPWRYGTCLVYDEIEEEFLPREKGMRVLPAPFFYDKKLYFELHKHYAPGEKKSFPNGGYEVVDVSGGIRSYDLDQVIIHPQVLQHKKMLDKMARKAEKQAKKRVQTLKKLDRENKVKHGRKGRPALDPAVKAHREQMRLETKVRSGGKRGRPSLNTAVKEERAVKDASRKAQSSGKKGRPPLSAVELEKRAAQDVSRRARSGGKRGRPKMAR
jgi:hypothetical protein